MNLSISMISGTMLSIVLIAGLAIYAGLHKERKNNKISYGLVAGLILGTFVGGSCTVGTAQLAYKYGICAWWYCLGGALACVLLSAKFVKPFRRSHCPTVVGIVSSEFGPTVGMTTSLLNSFGTFVNVLSQLIAATSVIAVIFPGVPSSAALIVSALFMILYVVFGGTRGAGMVGILKMVLIYVSMISCGILVLKFTHGLGGFVSMVNEIDNPDKIHFFSMLARGAGTDIGACLSLVVGILTTQTYAQAVISAKSDRDAHAGVILSACLVPPIGAGGILVGLYMRAHYPGILAKTALTQFVMTQMPGFLGGIVLGTLFITVIGTGAGLSLGIATIINHDVIQRKTERFSKEGQQQLVVKVLIACVLLLAAVCCMVLGDDTILNFAFLSMGLRGAVVLAPLCCALWLKGRIESKYAMTAVITGPVVVVIFHLIDCLPFDPLFLGIIMAFIVMFMGLARRTNPAKLCGR